MLIGRRRPLSAAQQFVNLRGNPICRGDGVLRTGRFTWRYSATPSPIGRDYDIRIEFKQDSSPEIFVDAPDLHALAGGQRIPHLYRQKPPMLCLYLPNRCEWQPWMRLDQTLVPWATLWLFYFEEWLASGDWKGGGIHPDGDVNRDCGDAA